MGASSDSSHIPLGPGYWAIFLANVFLKGGPMCSPVFEQNGYLYLRCEVLNSRQRQDLQDQLDVFKLLQGIPEFTAKLQTHHLKRSKNSILDIEAQTQRPGFFWVSVKSDLPSQLTEVQYDSLNLGHTLQWAEIDDQILSLHADYGESVLVRDSFQTFHRADGKSSAVLRSMLLNFSGFLLTMSPMADYHILDYFLSKGKAVERAGTTAWEVKSVEILILRIITELQESPFRIGGSVEISDIQMAYVPVVQTLVGILPHAVVFAH
ncbi:hypothetical protein ACLMJK_008248 [Lecanora helva]